MALRSALAVEAFRHTAAYDARIAEVLPPRMAATPGSRLPDEPGLPGASDPYPADLTIALEKVETLRYGENPHQPAARYRRPGSGAADGPFATGEPPLQGKALSYNNVLDAAAAAALWACAAGTGLRDRQAHQPVRRGGACDAPRGLGGRARGRPGLGLRRGRGADPGGGRPVAAALVSIFLEVVVAPGFDDAALAILATKPNLRLVVDPNLALDEPGPPPDPTGSIRSAGGAVLVTAPDTAPDDPATWTVATRRAPTEAELADLDLAWRLVRGVTSNAIVLVRDRRLIGMGSGQTSRVDAARGAVAQARAYAGDEALVGRRLRLGRVLPVPRCGRGLPRRRRHGVRPAGRVDARRRGRGGGRRRRWRDADDRHPALPPLTVAGRRLRLSSRGWPARAGPARRAWPCRPRRSRRW